MRALWYQSNWSNAGFGGSEISCSLLDQLLLWRAPVDVIHSERQIFSKRREGNNVRERALSIISIACLQIFC